MSSAWCCSARGIALLSYVLEVFGEHRLSGAEMLGLLALATVLLAGYGIRAALTAFPLLRSRAVQDPHLPRGGRAAASSRVSALGGMPFLFPLLYQVGLGFSPIQSGLLVLPQAVASIGLKSFHAGDPGAARLPQRAGRQHRSSSGS